MNSRFVGRFVDCAAGALPNSARLLGVFAALAILLPQLCHAQQASDAGAERQPLNLEMDQELPATAKPPQPPTPATPGPAAAAPASAAAAPAAASPGQKAPAPASGAADGKVRVIYLPESERQRIRDELRAEILETARKENWAQPGLIPEWVNRIHPDGDLLIRVERDLFDNSNSNEFFNFQSINSGSPVNVSPPTAGQPVTIPFLNSTQDRTLPRLRLRLGFSADVAQGVTAVVRLASGSASNPASEQQTLGSDFERYSFLIDRAYIRYQFVPSTSAELGRMPNPFVTPNAMVWASALSFDGVGLNFKKDLGEDLSLGAAGGAYSVENTDTNYPSSSFTKISSRDKWLFAGQFLANWRATDVLSFQPSLAYYYYSHVQGELSTPCFAPNTSVSCSSDDSRPIFVQKGNTMFAIRNLLLQNAGDPQYQYFGLASPFRIGDVTLSADARIRGPLHVALDAEYVRNFAFNHSSISNLQPVNNLGPCQVTGQSNCTQAFAGGGSAYQLQLRLGHPDVVERWDWQGALGCRYVETDAVVDAFADADFHLGGTNAKGCSINGRLGLARNTYTELRYFGGREVSGPPLSIDVLQVDFAVKF